MLSEGSTYTKNGFIQPNSRLRQSQMSTQFQVSASVARASFGAPVGRRPTTSLQPGRVPATTGYEAIHNKKTVCGPISVPDALPSVSSTSPRQFQPPPASAFTTRFPDPTPRMGISSRRSSAAAKRTTLVARSQTDFVASGPLDSWDADVTLPTAPQSEYDPFSAYVSTAWGPPSSSSSTPPPTRQHKTLPKATPCAAESQENRLFTVKDRPVMSPSPADSCLMSSVVSSQSDSEQDKNNARPPWEYPTIVIPSAPQLTAAGKRRPPSSGSCSHQSLAKYRELTGAEQVESLMTLGSQIKPSSRPSTASRPCTASFKPPSRPQSSKVPIPKKAAIPLQVAQFEFTPPAPKSGPPPLETAFVKIKNRRRPKQQQKEAVPHPPPFAQSWVKESSAVPLYETLRETLDLGTK